MADADNILIVEASGRGFLSHYAHALALGLQQRGHRVRLLTAPWDELAGWPAPFERKATVRPGLAGWRTLMAEVREFAPSVIHFQWLNDPVSTALFVGWAQRRGAAVVYTPHNLLPHRGRWMLTPLFQSLYHGFDRIVVRDTNMRWAASEILDVDPDRMAMALGSPNIIAHPGAPRRLPAELGPRQPGEIRALHFGHGNVRKGLQPLLQALARLDCPPGLHLMLAGAGVAAAIDPAVMAAARAQVRVSVIDRYLDPAEVGGLFAQADLVTMPYAKLCRSPILDLAAAFNKPVLRTDRVEATRFDEGRHGWTVDSGDSLAFAATLASLAAAPAQVFDAQQALARGPGVEDEMVRLAARHEDIYQQAMAERRARRPRHAGGGAALMAGE